MGSLRVQAQSGSTLLRDIVGDVLADLAKTGITAALRVALERAYKSATDVEKRPILNISWQIKSHKLELYSEKLMDSRLQEWGRYKEKIASITFRGKVTQTFERQWHNGFGTLPLVDSSPFSPEILGKFTTECKRAVTEHKTLIDKMECYSELEVYLEAKNFMVPSLHKGMRVQLVCYEIPVPPGCPSDPPPLPMRRETSKVVGWNSSAPIPYPTTGHAFSSLECFAYEVWKFEGN